ncbi:protein of unknown function [Vibrio tapetis subsp. tapetis]|uniref:Uncharacterized protein n=1 Tax=Vibrio tapetis subsp. tapetis TaxID=1671868 RepID=A0A2N8ZKE5_9VIBR|nr:protein of unknown function [Vibrio tapetis subsp. tapetis]
MQAFAKNNLYLTGCFLNYKIEIVVMLFF